MTDDAAETFRLLPAKTRKMLQNLRDKDVDQFEDLMEVFGQEGAVDHLKSALELAKTFSNFGRYSKYLFFGVAGVFISIAGAMTALEKISSYWHGGSK